jgi:hypothetical protein
MSPSGRPDAEDPNVGMNLGDVVKATQDRPPTPNVFKVELSSDREHVQFTVGYTGTTTQRSKISQFKIYFIPSSIFSAGNSPWGASGSQYGNNSLFYGTSLVATIGVSRDGSPSTTLNRQYCGQDGAFFAVSLNLAQHLESGPTPPCANPTAQYSANGAAIPDDVQIAQASFTPVLVNNTRMLQVNVSAKPPNPNLYSGTVNTSTTTVDWNSGQKFSYTWVNQNVLINGTSYLVTKVNSTVQFTISASAGTQTAVPYTYGVNSFAGYQVYIQNENNSDPFLKTYAEGPFFSVNNGTTSSGFIVGGFNIIPDAPAVYTLGGVDTQLGSDTVSMTAGSPAIWSPSWTYRRMTVIDNSYPQNTTNFDNAGNWLYDGQIVAMNTVAQPATIQINWSPSWVTGANNRYAIYQTRDATGSGQVLPHRVRLYFVSVSRAGTRRPDVLNSPYVEFPWGFTASPSLPMEPVGAAVTSQGVTMTLTWTTTTGLIDPTIGHYNIYRTRGGIYGTEVPTTRPVTPYATVRADQANNSGNYSFTDRNFNIDPTSAGYDFNPATPGIFWYYVTSVSVDGLENTLAYGGQAYANGGTTVTWVAGDYFIPQMVGQTLVLAGSNYTITGYTNSTTITIGTNGPAGTSGLTYTVGCVVRAGAVQGNTGGESDPSLYRDNMWNRLFNASFYTANFGTSLAVNQVRGASYDFVNPTTTTDGQIPWAGWDAGYKSPSNRVTYRWTVATPGSLHGTQADSFTIWEKNLVAGTAEALMFYNPTGVAGAFTGDMLFDPGTGAGTGIVWLTQFANKNKFVSAENLVLHAALRSVYWTGSAWAAGGNGSYAGNVYFNLAMTDTTTVPGTPYARWTKEVAIPLANITSQTQRFALTTKLHTPNVDGNDFSGVYAFVNGNATGTYVSGDNPYGVIADATALKITVDGVVYTISSITSTTIVMTGTYAGTTANHPYVINFKNATNDYEIETTFRLAVSTGDHTNFALLLSCPMLNGGLLPANFTVQMNPEDWPGGSGGGGGSGGSGGYGGFGRPPACVVGDTILRTGEGLKIAQEIKVGDVLFSWTNGRRKPNKVTAVHRGEASTLIKIVAGEKVLSCTDTHRVCVKRRCMVSYIRASNVMLGDEIVGCDGHSISYLRVECLERKTLSSPVPVYDFSLEKMPHNYIANSIICHNKNIHHVS